MTVQVQHLNKTFGKQQVLHDISLTIAEGEVVGLLGPNGAGKSTLMKLLIGLLRPDNLPDNPHIIQCPERIGYLPEQNPLYEEMYVREYLQFIARITRDDSNLDQLMQRLGLMDEANKQIRHLSKGYHQRVGLAQALIGSPQLLILDEPTTGLDPNQLTDIRRIIREESKQRTVILSTHILQEVKEMCSRVIILDHGHIRADIPMTEVSDLEQLFRECTVGQQICN